MRPVGTSVSMHLAFESHSCYLPLAAAAIAALNDVVPGAGIVQK
jgi:hypothetical protein